MRAALVLAIVHIVMAMPQCDYATQYYDTSRLSCESLATCDPSQFEAAPPTETSDRHCASACPRDRYIITPATPTTDVVCQQYISPCRGGLVQLQAAPNTTCVNAVYTGTIDTASASLASVIGVISVDMYLLIGSGAPPTLSLPALTVVLDGINVYKAGACISLDMHALTYTFALSISYSDQLAYLSLSSLMWTKFELNVFGNHRLTALSLDALTYTGQFISINNNTAASYVLFPKLRRVGGYVLIHQCTVATLVSLPELTYVAGYFFVSLCTSLTSLALPALSTVIATQNAFSIDGNIMMTYLSAPALSYVSSDIFICGDAPSLVTAFSYPLSSIATSCQIQVNDLCPVMKYACPYFVPTALTYPWSVANNVTVAALQPYTVIVGSVDLSSQALTSVTLPFLTFVGGDIALYDDGQLYLVRMDVLAYIGGSFMCNPSYYATANLSAIAGIGMPHLYNVQGDFIISNDCCDNAMLTTFSLPSLRGVNGSLTVSQASNLTYIGLSALVFVGDSLVFNRFCATQSTKSTCKLVFPSLVAVGALFQVSVSSYLTVISVPNLSKVGGGVHIESNMALTLLSAPSLASAAGGIFILANAVLTVLSLPALLWVGATPQDDGINISGNLLLTYIDMPSIVSVNAALVICPNNETLAAPQRLLAAAASVVCSVPFPNQHMCVTLGTCQSFIVDMVYPYPINNNATLDFLSQFTTFVHSVTLTSQNITSFELPLLRVLEVDLYLIKNALLAVINLPNLLSVGGVLRIYCAGLSDAVPNIILTFINLPLLVSISSVFYITSDFGVKISALTYVGVQSLQSVGSIQATFATAITSIAFPALTAVTGEFQFDYITSVQAVDLHQLRLVSKNFEMYSDTALTSLVLPALTYIGTGFTIQANTMLQAVDLRSLEHVGGVAQFISCPLLTSIFLPVLTHVSSEVNIVSNNALTSVAASSLLYIGMMPTGQIASLDITSNGNLGQLQFPLLAVIAGNVIICNNSASLVVPSLFSLAASTHACTIGSGSVSCADITSGPCS